MGTDIYLKYHLGWNCLHIAALCAHLNLSNILIIKHKFDVGFASNSGGIALHFSTRYGIYELVKLVADIGTDIHLKKTWGKIAFILQQPINICIFARHSYINTTLMYKWLITIDGLFIMPPEKEVLN